MYKTLLEILDDIVTELVRAEELHPDWPIDMIHASAVLSEEAGEVTKAALDWVYHGGTEADAIKEAIQCGAMSIRFLMNADNYRRIKTGKG